MERYPVEEIAFVKVESEMNDTNPISIELIDMCNVKVSKRLFDDKNIGKKVKKEMTHKVRILQQKVRRRTKRVKQLESLLADRTDVKPPVKHVKPRSNRYKPRSLKTYRSLNWRERLSEIKTTVQDTCRLCIAPLSKLLVRRKTVPFNDNELRILSDLNIKRDDGLPQEICSKCFNFFNDMQLFHRQAKRSQEILRKHFHTAITDIEIRRLDDNSDLLGNGMDREDSPTPQFLEGNEFTKKDEDLIGTPLNSTAAADVVSKILTDDKGVPTAIETIPLNEDDFSDEINGDKTAETKIIDPDRYCTICDRMFYSKASKLSHMEQHANETYECDICGKIYNRKSYLQSHMRRHSTTVLACSMCTQTFTNPFRYRYHLKSHDPSKRYKCGYCAKSFLQINHLINHENVHKDFYPHLCLICGLTIRLDIDYKSHMLTHPDPPGSIQRKTYDCDKCEKKFDIKSLLTKHQRCHTKPLKCDICDMRFSQAGHLRLHIFRTHTDNPDHGKKRSNRSAGFMGDDPKRQHVCATCGYAFQREYNLKCHINTVHLKIKPYGCSVCGKQFGQAADRNEHMKRHSNIRPFQCSFCPSKFFTKRVLNSHIIQVHKMSKDI